jgi:hypothetical protein
MPVDADHDGLGRQRPLESRRYKETLVHTFAGGTGASTMLSRYFPISKQGSIAVACKVL